jgi:DNA-binding transcriptional LysR family regulator
MHWKSEATPAHGSRHERCFAISSRLSPEGYRFLCSLYAQAGVPAHRIQEVDDGPSIIDSVAAGFGVAIVPTAFRERLGPGGRVSRPAEDNTTGELPFCVEQGPPLVNEGSVLQYSSQPHVAERPSKDEKLCSGR